MKADQRHGNILMSLDPDVFAANLMEKFLLFFHWHEKESSLCSMTLGIRVLSHTCDLGFLSRLSRLFNVTSSETGASGMQQAHLCSEQGCSPQACAQRLMVVCLSNLHPSLDSRGHAGDTQLRSSPTSAHPHTLLITRSCRRDLGRGEAEPCSS